MQQHQIYMQRAIDLAQLGAGNVSPNPMVGAVIVHNDRIIGEGWHKKYGEAHAEINALNSVTDKGLLAESTLYVTLEPCSHYGKTPPCANAIIESGIKKVVVGMTDPNPLVSGHGIGLLKQNGVEVIEQVLQEQCLELNKRFIAYMIKKRPYVILKWAQTSNGFIAPDINELGEAEFEKQRHITGLTAQKLTHKWRTIEDALMVGTNTITADNPKLNARAWEGDAPVRVVLDLNRRLPEHLNVFDDSQRTIVFVYTENIPANPYQQTQFMGIDPHAPLTPQVLEQLYLQKIQSVIVEGGTRLLQTFIDTRLWDQAQVLVSPKRFNTGVEAPKIGGRLVASTSLNHNRISIINPQ